MWPDSLRGSVRQQGHASGAGLVASPACYRVVVSYGCFDFGSGAGLVYYVHVIRQYGSRRLDVRAVAGSLTHLLVQATTVVMKTQATTVVMKTLRRRSATPRQRFKTANEAAKGFSLGADSCLPSIDEVFGEVWKAKRHTNTARY